MKYKVGDVVTWWNYPPNDYYIIEEIVNHRYGNPLKVKSLSTGKKDGFSDDPRCTKIIPAYNSKLAKVLRGEDG